MRKRKRFLIKIANAVEAAKDKAKKAGTSLVKKAKVAAFGAKLGTRGPW